MGFIFESDHGFIPVGFDGRRLANRADETGHGSRPGVGRGRHQSRDVQRMRSDLADYPVHGALSIAVMVGFQHSAA